MATALRGEDSYEAYLQGARARREAEEDGLGKDKRREMRLKGAQELLGPERILGENGEVLFTLLDEDDSLLNGPGEEAVFKEDLSGLLQKWGSRLRIRCTDDEVYFRLAGTHIRVRFSVTVMLEE